MSTDLVVSINNVSFTPERYNAMLRAIDLCVTIDDCAKAQSVAAAMAVYYQQIKDTVARRQLDEIRLRAWRKMSEIIARVDTSKCSTQRQMAQTVRDTLGASATEMLSDSRILQLIRLAGVPEQNFEAAVEKCGNSIDRMLYEAHPDSIRKRAEASVQQEHMRKTTALNAALEIEREARARQKAEQENDLRAERVIEMVKNGGIIEAPEVGLTLTPKIKSNLVTFSVMMDRKMHDQLRDAAHARRTTMWAILREAANYWFVVNGFEKV